MGELDSWLSRTVFRLRGLPNSVQGCDDVAKLLSERLGDVRSDQIHVYSLASTLDFNRSDSYSPTKVATIMFARPCALFDNGSGKSEWFLGDLSLDTHFLGLTPLNDVNPRRHIFDCIAISGLASHPFGSWQPKADKTYMWLRDELPEKMSSLRSIIYGYDSKLEDSRSFQNIPDLAQTLIKELQAYSGSSASNKSIAFLAHSLGGLLLKEAIVKLARSTDVCFQTLLGRIRGAIFFGVPNLGMDQASFKTVVHKNPNYYLVEDFDRGSNYLDQLDQSFSEATLTSQLKCFWAYETMKSPTLVVDKTGSVHRNGPLSILVSKASATCRFIDTNPEITFAIDADHSNLVKFGKGSRYCGHTMSTIADICLQSRSADNLGDNTDAAPLNMSGWPNTPGFSSISAESPRAQPKDYLRADLRHFNRRAGLTDVEKVRIQAATYTELTEFFRCLQEQHEREENLMYLQRLGAFIEFVKHFDIIIRSVDGFTDRKSAIAYLCGPVMCIVDTVKDHTEAFHSILDAYQELGDQISLQNTQDLFQLKPHTREVLVLMYRDILEFHIEIIRQVKQRAWSQLFDASWRGSKPKRDLCIQENLKQLSRLIESPNISIVQFEEILQLRKKAIRDFDQNIEAQDAHRLGIVRQWLCPFDSEPILDHHRATRLKWCKDPGRWLLNHDRFHRWFSPDHSYEPMLWLNGIPGAGKSVLASVIIDQVRQEPGAHVCFFFCKFGEKTRNSFMSVATSILAQLLAQQPRLLPFFFEKASVPVSRHATHISEPLVKEMMQTAFHNSERVYIIIDGLDECPRAQRKEISTWFRGVSENDSPMGNGAIRCLFVSQDDEIGRKDLRILPIIKVTNEGNQGDLLEFTNQWRRRIEEKFGELRWGDRHIGHILLARAQGMFIFAELLAKYLEDQPSRTALIEELKSDDSLVKLDHVYERILHRLQESKSEKLMDHLRQVFGWVVYARRPLRWREIQGAISTDLDQQHVDYNRKLLESPKAIFASLIEIRLDGTVELVHATARDYLTRTKFLQPRDVAMSLSMLSVAYLSMPQMDKNRTDEQFAVDLKSGIYSFYDYASACWALHLLDSVDGLDVDKTEELDQLQETLESFLEVHWSSRPKQLAISPKIQKSLSVWRTSDSFHKISQSVAWSLKQHGNHSESPIEEEATDIWEVTRRIRTALENLHSSGLCEMEMQSLQDFYGQNWYKCPRIHCYYYHHGFRDANDRERHVTRHERPYLCYIDGCPTAVFGCTTKDDLTTHLFIYHGINSFDDHDFPSEPEVRKHKRLQAAATMSEFQCPQCSKPFKTKHNLLAHSRTHDGIKSLTCDVCGKGFTYKGDLNRHVRGHGDKNFKCEGALKDGSTWGCGRLFARSDKLDDHLRSKSGQKCIRPRVLESLAERSGAAEGGTRSDQLGLEADRLLAAGHSLPSFDKFLHACGLNRSELHLLRETNVSSEMPSQITPKAS